MEVWVAETEQKKRWPSWTAWVVPAEWWCRPGLKCRWVLVGKITVLKLLRFWRWDKRDYWPLQIRRRGKIVWQSAGAKKLIAK